MKKPAPPARGRPEEPVEKTDLAPSLERAEYGEYGEDEPPQAPQDRTVIAASPFDESARARKPGDSDGGIVVDSGLYEGHTAPDLNAVVKNRPRPAASEEADATPPPPPKKAAVRAAAPPPRAAPRAEPEADATPSSGGRKRLLVGLLVLLVPLAIGGGALWFWMSKQAPEVPRDGPLATKSPHKPGKPGPASPAESPLQPSEAVKPADPVVPAQPAAQAQPTTPEPPSTPEKPAEVKAAAPEKPVAPVAPVAAAEPAKPTPAPAGARPTGTPEKPATTTPPVAVKPTTPSPPAQPARRGGTGTLIVKSSEKLEVFFDGKVLGQTPLKMEVPVGPHHLEVRTPGAEVGMKRALNVVEGGEHLLDMD